MKYFPLFKWQISGPVRRSQELFECFLVLPHLWLRRSQGNIALRQGSALWCGGGCPRFSPRRSLMGAEAGCLCERKHLSSVTQTDALLTCLQRLCWSFNARLHRLADTLPRPSERCRRLFRDDREYIKLCACIQQPLLSLAAPFTQLSSSGVLSSTFKGNNYLLTAASRHLNIKHGRGLKN